MGTWFNALFVKGGNSPNNLLEVDADGDIAVKQGTSPWVVTDVTGTKDVNLTKVGGTNITLGQKASSASLPTVLASDQSALGTFDNPYTTNVDYVGGTNPIYIGQAAPGTATSASLWSIVKFTYDGNGNPTAAAWAGGSGTANKKWDDRATYVYS